MALLLAPMMAADKPNAEMLCIEALAALAALDVEARERPFEALSPQLEILVRAVGSKRGVIRLPREEGEEPAPVATVELEHVGDDDAVANVAVGGAASLQIVRKAPFSQPELRCARVLGAQILARFQQACLRDRAQKGRSHVSLLFELATLGAVSRDVPSVLDRAMSAMRETFAAAEVSVHLWRDGRLVLYGRRGPSDPRWHAVNAHLANAALDSRTLVGLAGLERATVQLDAEHWPEDTRASALALGVRHGAATPLLGREDLLGVVAVLRTAEGRFTHDELRALESCAAQLATVVEHARILEEEQRRARHLASINEVGALVAQHLDLPTILTVGLRLVARIVGVSRTELFLLEPDDNVLRLAAASPKEDGASNLVIPIRQGSLVHQVLATGKPAWTADAMRDPRVSNDLARRYGYHAILEVPLVTDGEPMGVVALCDKQSARRFFPAEIETAVAICNQLATAIANARLFDDLRQSYEQLAKTQERLIGQERLAALGELAAVMAHEVRNPLAVIFNAVASLKKLEHPSVDAQTLLEIVSEEAEQLNRIVGDLLDFARPHDPVFRSESLEDLVWAALESSKGAEPSDGVEFAVEIGEELPTVSVDARLLKQALINLITNAIQVLPEGGRIQIRASRSVSNGKAAVDISVADDGPGIDGAVGERVTQPFVTTKASGTGLGLAIVKRIAETHEGALILAPTPGGGTTSTLRIPLRTSSVPPARTA